jgi:hypothetical protein
MYVIDAKDMPFIKTSRVNVSLLIVPVARP